MFFDTQYDVKVFVPAVTAEEEKKLGGMESISSKIENGLLAVTINEGGADTYTLTFTDYRFVGP